MRDQPDHRETDAGLAVFPSGYSGLRDAQPLRKLDLLQAKGLAELDDLLRTHAENVARILPGVKVSARCPQLSLASVARGVAAGAHRLHAAGPRLRCRSGRKPRASAAPPTS